MLLIHGRAALTGRLDTPEIPNGGIVVDGARIVAVGPREHLRADYALDEELGGEDVVVMPGLVSAHQHGGGLTSLQLGCPDQPFESWLLAMLGIPPLDIRLDTTVHAARLLAAGVTSTIHSHYTRDPERYEEEVAAILAGYRDVGQRVAFAPCFLDRNLLTYGEDEAFVAGLDGELATFARSIAGGGIRGDDYLPFVRRLLDAADPARERILFGPVAPQWCSESMLGAIGDAVRRTGAGAHLHVLESRGQREYLDHSLGRSVIAHLDDLGLAGPTVSYAHGVWLQPDEMDRLASSRTSVVVNSSCNLRLGNGIAPMGELIARGVNIGLGTDDMTLDDDDDLLREMRLARLLARPGGTWVDAAWALSAATLGGARAAGFADEVGSLEPGKRADVVLLDLSRISAPLASTEVGLLELVVGRASGRDVRQVFVDGEVVMDAGRHRAIDRVELDLALGEVGRAQAADLRRNAALVAARRLAAAHRTFQAAQA